jgi:alpha-galactosidase/6-phospho-beta-glucosidase family protein
MKIVFFGGGSHRYLSIARSVMAVPGLMDDGEIHLYDLAVDRAEAVGRLAMKSPEYQDLNCTISWGTELDAALEGADLVFVVLMAGSRKNFSLLLGTSAKHGFMASDQLSPSGAMLALKGGPILMDLARRMERICPDALLCDFANPVAVLSAAVNNHTKIKCLGVCAGYTNHQWDLSRILLGKDEQCPEFDVRCAGVNHMSFILPGSYYRGQDIYQMARQCDAEGWKEPVLSDRWNDSGRKNIQTSMAKLIKLYRKYGYLVFSSEGDGLAHLDIEGDYLECARTQAAKSNAEREEQAHKELAARNAAEQRFRAWLDTEMSASDWSVARPDDLYLMRADEDVMVKIAKAVGGIEEHAIATSFPNRGAVTGFTDRTVLEYSQILGKDGIRPVDGLSVPAVFQGLVSGLASHQTLLGDAIATGDPRVLFDALYSYPVQQDTAESKALWRDLLAVAAEEIPAEFQQTRDLFPA